MARRVKLEDRWLSPYTHAFVYKYKNGMAYTSIHSKDRRSTGYEFKPSNKRVIMEILEKRVREYHFPGEDKTPDKMLYEVIAEFTKIHILPKSPHTKKLYKSAFLAIFTEDCVITDKSILKKMIEDFIYNNNRLHNNSIQAYLMKINTFFNFCIEFKYISELPYSKRIIPKVINKPVKTFTQEDYDKIFNYLDYAGDYHFYYLLRVAQITGARVHEVLNMKWSDFVNWDDSNNASLTICGKAGNNGKKRTRLFPVDMFKDFRDVLNEVKNYSQDEYLFKYRNPTVVCMKFRKILNTVGIGKDKSFHTIRKTTTTSWRDKNILAEDRARLSGHSIDIETKIYNEEPNAEYYTKKYQKIEVLK